MKIHLNESEIIKGISLYVENLGISLQGKALEVFFTAGRKNKGLSADLTITQNTFVLNDEPDQSTLTLMKDISDALVSGTSDATGGLGNETRVSVEEESTDEPAKKVPNLFG